MGVQALIPFKPENPKTRLSCVLSPPEREQFARAMLSDVVGAVLGAGCSPRVISTAPFGFAGCPVEVIPSGLNEALNGVLSGMDGPVLVIMADLPLADAPAVRRLLETGMDVAIVPGRGGGTNAIYLSRGSSFRVDYYGASFLKHVRIARERGLSCEVVDSFRLHTDVDEEEDLVELLIHGEGSSRQFLVERGFELAIDRGRVGIKRVQAGGREHPESP
ncbi:MAG: 2-phospho-L-lactate guanylyltransferase [Methanolinea sp.]|nr:2-phospho-L-lactate guanylyltransferase [Methanolinea sp.]